MFPATTRLVLSNNKNYSVKLHVGLLAAQNLWDGANIAWKICKQCFLERLQWTSKDLQTAMFKNKQKNKNIQGAPSCWIAQLRGGGDSHAQKLNKYLFVKPEKSDTTSFTQLMERQREVRTHKECRKGKDWGLKRPNLRKILIKLEKVEIYWK